MSYEIILFDLDDTLIDFATSEMSSLKKIYTQFYPTVNYTHFAITYKQINDELWKRVGAKENGLMPRDVRFSRFEQLNETFACNTTILEVAETYDYHIGEDTAWLPAVEQAIQFLHQKGHILGIITNGLSEAQAKKRLRLGLNDWFDCFVVSDEVGIAKPNKEIFEMAVDNIANKRNHPLKSYDKKSMLMVGDSLISDGYGAQNFGIDYCHVNTNFSNINCTDATITYHIDSVARLPSCIGYEKEYADFLTPA